MGAINIVIIRTRCPACEAVARVRCQTHVAALYSERYSAIIEPKDYVLGETMIAKSIHSRRAAEFLSIIRGKSVTECCYAECELCHAALFAVIDFAELTPVAASQVGLETEWPDEFSR